MALVTRPYYRSTYVFVTRAGEAAPSSFDDPLLRRVQIGVQLIGDDFANTPPAQALAVRQIIGNVRGFTVYGDYREANPAAAIIRAVAAREIDVAVAWGPLGAYFARASAAPLVTRPVGPGGDRDAPLTFAIAMGVGLSNPPLRDEIDAILLSQRPAIDRILDAFAVPRLPLREEARMARAQ